MAPLPCENTSAAWQLFFTARTWAKPHRLDSSVTLLLRRVVQSNSNVLKLLQKSSRALKTFFQLLQTKRLQLKLTNTLQNPTKYSHNIKFLGHGSNIFFCPARCLSAGLRYLRLTRLPRHDRGPVPGGNRSAASCLCTVLRRALYHYATRSPFLGHRSNNIQKHYKPQKQTKIHLQDLPCTNWFHLVPNWFQPGFYRFLWVLSSQIGSYKFKIIS